MRIQVDVGGSDEDLGVEIAAETVEGLAEGASGAILIAVGPEIKQKLIPT
jgi:hypothetical protein